MSLGELSAVKHLLDLGLNFSLGRQGERLNLVLVKLSLVLLDLRDELLGICFALLCRFLNLSDTLKVILFEGGILFF